MFNIDKALIHTDEAIGTGRNSRKGVCDNQTEGYKMNAAHLDYRTEETLGHRFYRVNNDINGNPRYVISWLAFETEGKDLEDSYQKAKKLANSIGFKVYRGKDFGGGFVCQSYNLESTAERIIKTRGE